MQLENGSKTPIENLKAGDKLASLQITGMSTDASYPAQYQWLSSFGISTSVPRSATVAEVTFGEHTGFFVINSRIKVTFEHPFMVRRGDEWGFCSADLLKLGDYLVREDQSEEKIESIERYDEKVSTVSIHVSDTNTFLAEGIWVHDNYSQMRQSDAAAEATAQSSMKSGSHSASGSHHSGSHASSHSGSGKHSGSSFHSSGHWSGTVRTAIG